MRPGICNLIFVTNCNIYKCWTFEREYASVKIHIKVNIWLCLLPWPLKHLGRNSKELNCNTLHWLCNVSNIIFVLLSFSLYNSHLTLSNCWELGGRQSRGKRLKLEGGYSFYYRKFYFSKKKDEIMKSRDTFLLSNLEWAGRGWDPTFSSSFGPEVIRGRPPGDTSR